MDNDIKIVLKNLEEKVDRLIGAVLGNGQTGLIIRVDRIEQEEKKRQNLPLRLDRLEQRAAFRSKLLWTVGGGSVLAIITVLVTIFLS